MPNTHGESTTNRYTNQCGSQSKKTFLEDEDAGTQMMMGRAEGSALSKALKNILLEGAKDIKKKKYFR